MQSTQAQYKQALANAGYNFIQALGGLMTNLDSVLRNDPSMQMDVKIQRISSKMDLVRDSLNSVRETTGILKNSLKKPYECRSLEVIIDAFCFEVKDRILG